MQPITIAVKLVVEVT